jgi:hypothetical protein
LHGRTFKTQFLEEEKIVDLVGPDAYKDLTFARSGRRQKCNYVILSKDETYGDISPVR